MAALVRAQRTERNVPDEPMTVGRRLVDLRQRSQLTLNEIAEAADYSGRSSVQRFFSDDYDPPFLDGLVADRLARALVGRGKPPITGAEIFALTAGGSDKSRHSTIKQSRDLPQDTPIYTGRFALIKSFNEKQVPVHLYLCEQDNPIGYAYRPPAYDDRRGFRGYLISGVSPYIWHDPGDYIFIDDVLPPRRGDLVAINLKMSGFTTEFVKEIDAVRPISLAILAFLIFEGQTSERVICVEPHSRASVGFSHDNVVTISRVLKVGDVLVR